MAALRIAALTLSHTAVASAAFATGIYVLPILVEPDPPSAAQLEALEAGATYKGRFRRDLPGSDFLHWGEGVVAVGPDTVSLRGQLSPGPDYKVYLSRGTADTAEEFLAMKPSAARLGDVRSFGGFVLALPPGVDVADYDSVVVWCETFEMLISAAQYRF